MNSARDMPWQEKSNLNSCDEKPGNLIGLYQKIIHAGTLTEKSLKFVRNENSNVLNRLNNINKTLECKMIVITPEMLIETI